MAIHQETVEQINASAYQTNIFVVDPPPLDNGDRLTRAEFERRYEAMPHIKKAELIEGVVYMASPVRHIPHGRPHGLVVSWLGTYFAFTPGVDFSDNATIRLDADNEPQPDALLRLEPEQGGTSHVSDDDYIEGPPELIVEIAASSASYDLHDKKNVYRRNGVQEYIVWRVYNKQIDYFSLQKGEYIRLLPDEEGVVHSLVFPGLQLAVDALIKGDLATVLDKVKHGVDTEDHAIFVEQLSQKAG